jgi:transposase-like protein
VAAAKTDTVRTAYLEGRSIAALAREHGVSRGVIRTAVINLLPNRTAIEQEEVTVPELPVTLDTPGKVVGFLCTAELERAALGQGMTVRRGQGYTLRISAVRLRNLSTAGALLGSGASSVAGCRSGARR